MTDYSLIAVTFNGSQLGNLESFYAGRSGLTLLLCGCFFLIIGISLSFKTLKEDEARTILEDDELENKKEKHISKLSLSNFE